MSAVTEVNRTLRVLSGRTPDGTMPVIVTGLVRPGVDSFHRVLMTREDWARPLGLASLRDSGVPADAVGFIDGVPVVVLASRGPVRVFAVLLAVDHPVARDCLREVVFVDDMSRATGAELLRPLAELFSVPKAESSARATHRLAAFVFSGPVARCMAVVMEGAHAEMVEGPTFWSSSMSTSGTWLQHSTVAASSTSSSSSAPPSSSAAASVSAAFSLAGAGAAADSAPSNSLAHHLSLQSHRNPYRAHPSHVNLEALNSTSIFSEGMQSEVVARTRALAALKPEELGPETPEAHRARIVQESREAHQRAVKEAASSLSPSKNPISPTRRQQPLPSSVIGQRTELLRKFDRAITPDQKRALAHEAAAFEESVYHSFEQVQQPPPPKSPVASAQGVRLNLSNVEHPRGPSVSMLEAHNHQGSAAAAQAQVDPVDDSMATPPLGHSEDAMKRYSLEPTFNIHGMHGHRNHPEPRPAAISPPVDHVQSSRALQQQHQQHHHNHHHHNHQHHHHQQQEQQQQQQEQVRKSQVLLKPQVPQVQHHQPLMHPVKPQFQQFQQGRIAPMGMQPMGMQGQFLVPPPHFQPPPFMMGRPF